MHKQNQSPEQSPPWQIEDKWSLLRGRIMLWSWCAVLAGFLTYTTTGSGGLLRYTISASGGVIAPVLGLDLWFNDPQRRNRAPEAAKKALHLTERALDAVSWPLAAAFTVECFKVLIPSGLLVTSQ